MKMFLAKDLKNVVNKFLIIIFISNVKKIWILFFLTLFALWVTGITRTVYSDRYTLVDKDKWIKSLFRQLGIFWLTKNLSKVFWWLVFTSHLNFLPTWYFLPTWVCAKFCSSPFCKIFPKSTPILESFRRPNFRNESAYIH